MEHRNANIGKGFEEQNVLGAPIRVGDWPKTYIVVNSVGRDFRAGAV
jgi:hypothetical protein